MRFIRSVEALAVMALMLGSASARGGASPEAAEAAWQRLQGLAGTWKGQSSKGWEERIVLRLIANGSVLWESSRFADDASGSQAMATAYHKDGDRLLLTHYCEAGNQPRLVASSVADEGATVTFTFLDGTNLPSRDRGHMDTVVIRFLDREHFSSRWTWFEDGHEKWLEDIRYERIRE
jgi:hypothetical protein